MIMEIGLGDSSQGLRRQTKAYVTLIHALSLPLQPPAHFIVPSFQWHWLQHIVVPASLMIYLHQGMLVVKWMHKAAV